MNRSYMVSLAFSLFFLCGAISPVGRVAFPGPFLEAGFFGAIAKGLLKGAGSAAAKSGTVVGGTVAKSGSLVSKAGSASVAAKPGAIAAKGALAAKPGAIAAKGAAATGAVVAADGARIASKGAGEAAAAGTDAARITGAGGAEAGSDAARIVGRGAGDAALGRTEDSRLSRGRSNSQHAENEPMQAIPGPSDSSDCSPSSSDPNKRCPERQSQQKPVVKPVAKAPPKPDRRPL